MAQAAKREGSRLVGKAIPGRRMICARRARLVGLVAKLTVSAAECDRHLFPGRVPSARGAISPFPALKNGGGKSPG